MNPVQRHKIAVFAAKAADRFRGDGDGKEALLNAVLAMIEHDFGVHDVRFRAAILDYRHHYSKQS